MHASVKAPRRLRWVLEAGSALHLVSCMATLLP
jgi:hypothetical protein